VIDIRTRLVAMAGALVVMAVIVDLVRRRRLKEEYSVLWLLTAVVLLVLAGWLEALQWITVKIGGVAPSSTLFFFGLLFAFMMLLHFSVRVSALERKLTSLVQEIGLMGVQPGKRPPDGDGDGEAADAGAEADAEADAAAREAARSLPPVRGGSPRLAVIVPCFNDGALAEEAVASIDEDEPVELVVVDDGSTDPDTLERLSAMEARGVQVVRRDNGGLGAARTTGLRATTAEYVYPLDSDDLMVPGALAAMADALERHPEAGFVWGDYELFGDYEGYYSSPDRWLPWTLTYVNPYPVLSMFRRDVIERMGGWEGWAYEDWDLWLRLIDAGIEGVPAGRAVYRRRLHGSSRLLGDARRRHQELYAELQRRNARVFGRRGELRRAERPALWKRAAYPVLFGARKVVPFRVEAFLQRTMMRLGTGLPG
jgi:glycosyltransferase involved in cell wall biosynthesis